MSIINGQAKSLRITVVFNSRVYVQLNGFEKPLEYGTEVDSLFENGLLSKMNTMLLMIMWSYSKVTLTKVR